MSTQPPTPSPARSTRPAARSPLVFLAVAGASVLAAGVGGYVAQSHRHRTTHRRGASGGAAIGRPGRARPRPRAAASSVVRPRSAASRRRRPRRRTYASKRSPVAAPPAANPVRRPAAPAPEPVEKPRGHKRADAIAPRVAAATPAPTAQAPLPPARTAEPAPAVEMSAPEPPAVAVAAPPAPVETAARPSAAQVSIADTFDVPAGSVIGLAIEHSVSSETAQPRIGSTRGSPAT